MNVDAIKAVTKEAVRKIKELRQATSVLVEKFNRDILSEMIPGKTRIVILRACDRDRFILDIVMNVSVEGNQQFQTSIGRVTTAYPVPEADVVVKLLADELEYQIGNCDSALQQTLADLKIDEEGRSKKIILRNNLN